MPRKYWQGKQETKLKYPEKAQKEREQTIIRKVTHISHKYGNDFAITGVIENNEGYIYYPNKQCFQNFLFENRRKYSNVLSHTHHLKTKNEILLFKKKFKGLQNKILEYSTLLNKKIYFVVYEKNTGDFFYFGDAFPEQQNENKKSNGGATVFRNTNHDDYNNNELVIQKVRDGNQANSNYASRTTKYKIVITKTNFFNLFQTIFKKIQDKKRKQIINFCLKNYPSYFEKINSDTS